MAVKSKFTSDFNAAAISVLVARAAQETVEFLSGSLQDYIIERFSEDKSGERYWIRELAKYYDSSAPGEYPAIKLGTLKRSMGVEPVEAPGTFTHLMGPRRLEGVINYKLTPEPGKVPRPGARTNHDVPNDPYYASYLEEERMRPYFSRAADETDAKRPDHAANQFVAAFMRFSEVK